MESPVNERREAERRTLARNGECVFLGLPVLSAEQHPVSLAPLELNDVRLGSTMQFECRKLKCRVTLGFCTNCHEFKPLLDGKDGPLAIGVTTSPREPSTLYETIESLESGFPGCVKIFSNDKELGAMQGPFGSFYSMMTQLAMRFPHAGAYFYCQDDVLLKPGAKAWLESLETDRRHWVMSLYRPPEVKTVVEGHPTVSNLGYNTPGACTLIFSPAALRDLLSDPWVSRWRWRGEDGWRRIDQVVGAWASKFDGIIYPLESLAEHIGHVSSKFKHNPEGRTP